MWRRLLRPIIIASVTFFLSVLTLSAITLCSLEENSEVNVDH